MTELLEPRRLFTSLVAGFTEEVFTSGLSNTTAMEFAPDGRLFVSQQAGQLRVVKNGVLNATPFMSLTVDSSGERGLLGIAFDPNFTTNRFVYVYYTVPTGGGVGVHNRVSRFTASATNADVVEAGSEVQILNLDGLSGATNHNGGAIHFGPDGKLYVAVGENANGANAQTLNNRLGKMLRINSDGTIPTDNPFYTTATGANRSIWALGLRNPFTFAFDTDGTMYINDVGENTWEEINLGVAGANYGWNQQEGPETTPNPAFADPLFSYNHAGANDISGNVIAGGTFYRAPAGATNPFPAAYNGDYFYADSGHGWLRWLDDNTANTNLASNGIYGIVDLKTGPDGSVYYLVRGNGTVTRLRYSTTPSVTLDLAAASDTGVSSTDNITKNNALTFTGTALASSTVKIFADGTQVGTTTATAGGTYSVTTSALATGTRQITVTTSTSSANATSAALAVVIDQTAPTLSAGTFDFLTAQRIKFTSSEDIRPSLDLADLVVVNTTNGQTIPTSAFTLTPGGGSGAVYFGEWSATTLPDGNYTATLAASGVTDLAGNPLAANGIATFFVLAADSNHDRKVNFDDLIVLAMNYGMSGKTFGQGDYNYDSMVNFDDLVLLAQRYNSTLAPAMAVSTTTKTKPQRKRDLIIV